MTKQSSHTCDLVTMMVGWECGQVVYYSDYRDVWLSTGILFVIAGQYIIISRIWLKMT